MKLNDIGNMEYYLQNDCYCPGEIYDVSGFFFQVFNKDDECEKLGGKKSKNNNRDIVCVACKNQIINFWLEDNEIVSAERYDATENNMKLIKLFLTDGNTDGMFIDEFEKGSSEQTLKEILQMADAVMI